MSKTVTEVDSEACRKAGLDAYNLAVNHVSPKEKARHEEIAAQQKAADAKHRNAWLVRGLLYDPEA